MSTRRPVARVTPPAWLALSHAPLFLISALHDEPKLPVPHGVSACPASWPRQRTRRSRQSSRSAHAVAACHAEPERTRKRAWCAVTARRHRRTAAAAPRGRRQRVCLHHTGVARRWRPVVAAAGATPGAAAGSAHAGPGAGRRRAVPLPLRHGRSASAASAASSPATSRTAIPRRSTGAASARSKAAGIPSATRVVPLDGLQPLPRADLPDRLPGRRLHEGCGDRHRAAQRRRLHRLPVLHVELLVRRAAVQPRARRRRQVRHVPRPARRPARRRPASTPARRARSPSRSSRSPTGAPRWPATRPPPRACRPATTACPRRASRCPRTCRRTPRPRDLTHVAPEHPHWPLVVMTVLTQLSVGAFATIWLLQLLGASTRPRHRRADVADSSAAWPSAPRRCTSGRPHSRLSRAAHVAPLVAQPRGAAVQRVLRRRRRLRRDALVRPARQHRRRRADSRCSGSPASRPAPASTACRRGRRGTRRTRWSQFNLTAAHARPAVRRRRRRRRPALAGDRRRGHGRARSSSLVALRFFRCIASDSLELRGTARLLSDRARAPLRGARRAARRSAPSRCRCSAAAAGSRRTGWPAGRLAAGAAALALAGEIVGRYLFFVSVVPKHLAAPYLAAASEAA